MPDLPDRLGPWWPALIKTAERGGYSEGDVLRKIAAGHTIVIEAPCFIMLIDRSADGACVVWLCAGERVRAWSAGMERSVGEFAKKQGCDRLRIEGRKGWARLLRHWTLVAENDGEVTLELTI